MLTNFKVIPAVIEMDLQQLQPSVNVFQLEALAIAGTIMPMTGVYFGG